MSTATRAPLWQLDAGELGAAYRAGALTPLAVLDAQRELTSSPLVCTCSQRS